MTILDLTVTGLIVIVLCLIVLFVLVGVRTSTLNFKLCKEEQIISGCCNCTRCIAGITCIICVLRNRLHDSSKVRRQSRHKAIRRRRSGSTAVAQQSSSTVASIPTTRVCIRQIHSETLAGTSVEVVGIAECDIRTARSLTNLEVDTVRTFLAAVVVESENKRSHGAVHRHTLNSSGNLNILVVAHVPVGGTSSCVGHRLDVCPAVLIQSVADKTDTHVDGLRRRSGMVRISRNIDCNHAVSGLNTGDSDNISADRGCSNLRVIGRCADSSGAISGNRDGIRLLIGHNLNRRFVLREGARLLTDRPVDRLCRCRAIGPLVFVILERRLHGVRACICRALSTAQRHLGCVVPGQRRGLRCAVVGKSAALSRHSRYLDSTYRDCDRCGIGLTADGCGYNDRRGTVSHRLRTVIYLVRDYSGRAVCERGLHDHSCRVKLVTYDVRRLGRIARYLNLRGDTKVNCVLESAHNFNDLRNSLSTIRCRDGPCARIRQRKLLTTRARQGGSTVRAGQRSSCKSDDRNCRALNTECAFQFCNGD